MKLVFRYQLFKNLQKPTIVFTFWSGSRAPLSTNCPSQSFVGDPSSEIADYLVNSCGFTSEAARVVSTRLRGRGTVRTAKKTIDFFRESGFTGTQITKSLTRDPQLLSSKVEKTLMPKIKVFHDSGLSKTDIAQMVAGNPVILSHSLQNYVLPVLNVIKDFLPDKEKARSIKLFFSRMRFTKDVHERVAVNLSYLRRCGVPDQTLVRLITRRPIVLSLNPSLLEKTVDKAGGLGFRNDCGNFCEALFMVRSIAESVLAAKIEFLKGFGWTLEQTMTAIHKFPFILNLAPSTLKKKMEFLVESGLDPAEIAEYPTFLTYDLEKRMIPRMAVIRALDSRNLIKRKPRLSTILVIKEESFYEKYVLKHKGECPDMFEAYKKSTNVATIASELS